jgi:hypothetical protein
MICHAQLFATSSEFNMDLDSHTSAPRCNALLRKPLHAPTRRSTQFFLHAHWMSHADAPAPTNTSSTNHEMFETSTTNLTISRLQNYIATLSNLSSSQRLHVKTVCHHIRSPRLPHTLTHLAR